MLDLKALEALMKSRRALHDQIRAIGLKLPLLNSGTGKQRNELVLDLSQFMKTLRAQSSAELHTLQNLYQAIIHPDYLDTLGYESGRDLSSVRNDLNALIEDYKAVWAHQTSGTQPREWLDHNWGVMLVKLCAISNFVTDILSKV